MVHANVLFVIAISVLPIYSEQRPDSSTIIRNETIPNFVILSEAYGFSPVQYEVVTEDGYILRLFRIPGKSRLPVLIVHGLLDSADTWIIRGKNSIGINLANRGYDVWFANTRGNRYSRRHIHLNPDEDASFWKYSFHEVGYYDLPAFIDRILEETNSPSLSVIGHSQGTTAFYVLGSTRQEYNAKVNVLIALSPVCYFNNPPLPISILIELLPFFDKILSVFNMDEFFGDTSAISKIIREVCPEIGYTLCIFGILFPITGFDAEELEPTFYPTVLKHFPSGTSSRSFLHYLQLGSRKIFAPFDNGHGVNRERYNSTAPPPYDLGLVNMPIALFTANNDFLATTSDVVLLKDKLPNVVYHLINPYQQLNHMDFIWGRRLRIYLLPHILKILQRFNS